MEYIAFGRIPTFKGVSSTNWILKWSILARVHEAAEELDSSLILDLLGTTLLVG